MSLIGELLFNEYNHLFIGAAFLLLIAMIGAILLTLDYEKIKINIKNEEILHLNIN